MTETERKNLEWYRSLPVMYFDSVDKIKELYEYSATNPTGVTIGKMWRRLNGDFDQEFNRKGGIPKWVVCRYEEAPPSLLRRREGYLSTVPPDEWPSSPPPGYVWVEMAQTVTYRPVVKRKMGRHEGESLLPSAVKDCATA